MRKYFLLLMCISVINCHSQIDTDDCISMYRKLIEYSKKAEISKHDIDACVSLMDSLEKCIDVYYDSIPEISNYVSNGLTKQFAEICFKSNEEYGIDAFMDYQTEHIGSAEEELCFTLEQALVKYPELVLSKVDRDKVLLDKIVWGFLNNHYSMDGLDTDNYEKVFYETNPYLKNNRQKYSWQIEYILSGVYEQLKCLKAKDPR